ncbi:MAG TPA: MFS transporter [Candidatus Aquilonibacter sp.]|nr:MFS transporter [Candidatus Aquilonibacter sp.]
MALVLNRLLSDQTETLTAESAALERRTVRHVVRHIIPFLGILYLVNFLDRTNVGFAALRMNGDIGLSARLYAVGAGVFFFGYFVAEIPSNVGLHKFGARVWIAGIMVTWGIVAASMGFLRTPAQFIGLRVLLGVAEAGFFPGIIFLLSLWIPRMYLARTIATFYLGVPVSQAIGAPLSTGLMELGSRIGLPGWRLMYVCEGIPAVLLGVACLFYLTDTPSKAHWLASDERNWLVNTLADEEREKLLRLGPQLSKAQQVWRALTNPIVWALSLIYFGITSGSNSMNYILPSVLQSFRHTFGMNISLLSNGFITAIPYALAAVVMLFWTRRSDRLQERRKHAGYAALLAAVAMAIALLINNPVVIIVGFVLLAIGGYSAINVFWAIPQRVLTGLEAAAGIALINSIGNLSGFSGPYITNFFYSISGRYTVGFLVIAALVGLGGIGALLLPESKVEGAMASSAVSAD